MSDTSRELTADHLRRRCETDRLTFTSTAELQPLEEVIGQERAVRAVSFGVDIASPGYHMYALGPSGTGKTAIARQLLERRAADRPVPDDWCYVNNFTDPEQPRALRLSPGMGRAFRGDMDRLVEELEAEVPRAFEGEEYARESQRIEQDIQRKQQEAFERLRAAVEEKGFRVVQNPRGVFVAPVVDDKVVTPDTFEELRDQDRKRIEETQAEVQETMRAGMRELQTLQREAKERLRDLDREVVRFTVHAHLDHLRDRYGAFPAVVEFLDAVQDDIIEHVKELKELRQSENEQPTLAMVAGQGRPRPGFDQYRVNLVVDNGQTSGAPVVLERNPTHHNLVGRVEQEARFGALVTNFGMIRSGALHRANGGYLLLEARDLLSRPFAWMTLKRALEDREVKIESMAEEYYAISTRTLRPEPIPLDVKVVLIGDGALYYLLQRFDDDFRELFKVKADFAMQTDWNDETLDSYARFIGGLCREQGLRHFEPSGVARVVEHAARVVSDQRKLATRFGAIVDLVHEASFWAGKNGHELVDGEDVLRAVEEKVHRANRIEERIRELIADGTIAIDTEGAVVGQVNGISVLTLGDYAFGRPSRITARTHVGRAGVVNIDRESKLSGRIHTKGTMILAGYLGGRYGADIPLTLSGSITFEQLYEEVDGDSASSSELYALLSSLSGLPVRQDLAVTGSIDQHGRVQAIGGVNEKIEGFYDVCRVKGLTGGQGVIIPRSNVHHLMLREDVVEAVSEGRFHIYRVGTVDEGIELLTGTAAGACDAQGVYPEGSVNRAVQDRLRELAERARSFAREGEGKDAGAKNGP